MASKNASHRPSGTWYPDLGQIMSKRKFLEAIANAVGEDIDSLDSMEIIETHEPVSDFRPEDVISGKLAGNEYKSIHGVVVERSKMKRVKGEQRHSMYIWRDEAAGVTFVGHLI